MLADYIQQVPYLELSASFKEAISAGSHLQEEKTDLIFLDIHLPKLKGLSFLRTLQNPPAIIVTTAYHEYAVEGFELNVADYLLKPFSFERFIAGVNKVSKLVRAHPTAGKTESPPETSLFLTIDRKKVRIEYNQVLYIESRREYIKIVTLTSEYISKISTTEVEQLLPKPRFTRVHRSFIVAVDKVDSYTRGKIEIKGTTIPLGKGYKNETLFSGISK